MIPEMVCPMNSKAILERLFILFVASIVALFLFETGTCFLSTQHLISINTPTYSLSLDEGHEFSRPWTVDINEHFGVWHPPNTTSQHVKACFDVTYESNSYGARDSEQLKNSYKNQIVMLGDSFIEGFGVEQSKRLSDLLEVKTGIPHLNFGTSGDFGPTQYFLLYKSLAKNFTHSAIVIGILPINDFADDNYLFGEKIHQERYRPYWVGEYPDYKLVYFQEDLASSRYTVAEFERILKQNEMEIKAKQEKWDEQGLTVDKLKTFLRRFSYAYNALVDLKNKLTQTHNNGRTNNFIYRTDNYSGYYDFTNAEFVRLKYSLEKIVQEAHGKPVYVFTIPVKNDFLRYGENNDPPLSKELHKLCNQIGIEYVDLLPLMYTHTSDHDDYFFSCDGHWNEFGNQIAFEILFNTLPIYNNLR